MPWTDGPNSVWWEEQGEGEPLLLVMGHVYGLRMWHRIAPVLAERCRVISFDHRGIGGSVHATPHETIPEMAADAVAVLDAAGVDSAHVYGASMGGLVAQEMALAHPERLRSLVLACTGAPSDTTPRDGRLATLRYFIPPGTLFRLLRFVTYAGGTAPDLLAQDRHIVATTPYNRAALFAQGRAQARYRSRSRISALNLPVLVLHGDNDRIVPLRYGEDLATAIPGARLHVLRGAGHIYMTDATDEANAAVLDFLSEQSSAKLG